jgi:hypothetical protein
MPEIADILNRIKSHVGMNFILEGPEELYAFLQGYDSAKGTDYCQYVLAAISKKKRTGNVVPVAKDISIEEALDIAIDVICKGQDEALA